MAGEKDSGQNIAENDPELQNLLASDPRIAADEKPVRPKTGTVRPHTNTVFSQQENEYIGHTQDLPEDEARENPEKIISDELDAYTAVENTSSAPSTAKSGDWRKQLDPDTPRYYNRNDARYYRRKYGHRDVRLFNTRETVGQFDSRQFQYLCRVIDYFALREEIFDEKPKEILLKPAIVDNLDKLKDSLQQIELGIRMGAYQDDAARALGNLMNIASYRNVAREIAYEHLDRIEHSALGDLKPGALYAIKMLADQGGKYAPEAADILLHNISRLKALALRDKRGVLKPEFVGAFGTAYEKGDRTQKLAIMKAFEEIISTKEFGEMAKATIAGYLQESRYPDVQLYGKLHMAEILDAYHLPFEPLLQAWKDVDDHDLADNIERNLQAIIRLEKSRPGSAAIAEHIFGIRTFDRYPTELLAKQVKDYADTTIDYGLIAMGRWDHNDAFYSYISLFNSLARQLRKKVHIRFVEFGSRKEAVQRANNMIGLYGEGKAQFGIFAFHGSGNDFIMGAKRSKHDDVYTKDLRNRRVKKLLQSIFISDPSIVAESCRSNNGIAIPLAELFGLEVTAPEGDQGINEIKVRIVNGKPRFNVEFEEKPQESGLEHLLERLLADPHLPEDYRKLLVQLAH